MKNPSISRAVAIVGNQSKLATATGVSRQHIHQILNYDCQISAGMAVKIETATHGIVTRRELRPDLFDMRQTA